MKFDLYDFKDGEVQLSFKFEKNTKLLENKVKFLGLLHQAIKELNMDIPTGLGVTGDSNKLNTPLIK